MKLVQGQTLSAILASKPFTEWDRDLLLTASLMEPLRVRNPLLHQSGGG